MTTGRISDDFYADHGPELNDAPVFDDDETVNADGYMDEEIAEMLNELHLLADDEAEEFGLNEDDDAAYDHMMNGYDGDDWE